MTPWRGHSPETVPACHMPPGQHNAVHMATQEAWPSLDLGSFSAGALGYSLSLTGEESGKSPQPGSGFIDPRRNGEESGKSPQPGSGLSTHRETRPITAIVFNHCGGKYPWVLKSRLSQGRSESLAFEVSGAAGGSGSVLAGDFLGGGWPPPVHHQPPGGGGPLVTETCLVPGTGLTRAE